jgi:hypothetical protein
MNNIYCKDLLIDFVIDTKPIEDAKLIVTEKDSIKGGIFPIKEQDSRFVSLLNTLDLAIVHSEIFYSPPGAKLFIHIDGPSLGKPICKINWIFGADGSFMTWYKLKDETTTMSVSKTAIGTDYLFLKEEECDESWRAEVRQPSLINAGIPHSMTNPTNEYRWCMSYVIADKRTKSLLRWEDAEIRFSKFFKN